MDPQWQYTPLVIPLGVSLVVLLGLILLGIRRRKNPMAWPFLGFMGCLLIWIVTSLLELLTLNLRLSLLMADLSFLGITFFSVSWLGIVMIYNGRGGRFRRLLPWLVIIPILTNIVIWTNPLHRLWRGDSYRDLTTTWFPISIYDYGPWFYNVHMPFGLGISFLAMFLLLRSLFFREKVYRAQIITLLIAFNLPLIADIVHRFGFNPIPHYNLAPIVFSISGVLVGWTLLGFRFMDLTPIARDLVLENMLDAVLVLDDQGRVVDLNPAARQHLFEGEEAVVGQALGDLLPDQDNLIRQITESSYSQKEIEIQQNSKDRIYSVHISPILYPSRDKAGTLLLLRDITRRKQLEKVMGDSYNRLLILQRIDNELSRKLDVHYVVTRILDVALRLSGADTGMVGIAEGDTICIIDAVGSDLQKQGSTIPQNQGIMARVIRQQEPELILDVNADADYVAINPATRAQMILPLIAQQRLIGILSLETEHPHRFGSDTFDFLKLLASRVALALENAYAYEKQARLVKELDAFAHTVAHDLKNPLGVIIGCIDLLRSELPQPTTGDAQRFMNLLESGGSKMSNIIDELLLLASVRQLEDIEITSLNMKPIVEEALSRLTLVIEERQARISLHEPDTWPAASGYAGWVEEVWANYLSNAIKYGGTPPIVEVGVTLQDDGMVCCWVRDNGPGIEAEQHARLFTQFTRLDGSRASGHGLGLSIVQRIVDRLGGQVRVDSAIGTGSTFSFLLPASRNRL